MVICKDEGVSAHTALGLYLDISALASSDVSYPCALPESRRCCSDHGFARGRECRYRQIRASLPTASNDALSRGQSFSDPWTDSLSPKKSAKRTKTVTSASESDIPTSAGPSLQPVKLMARSIFCKNCGIASSKKFAVACALSTLPLAFWYLSLTSRTCHVSRAGHHSCQ